MNDTLVAVISMTIISSITGYMIGSETNIQSDLITIASEKCSNGVKYVNIYEFKCKDGAVYQFKDFK